MSNVLIRKALERKLNTWAAAQSPAIAVARENVTFTPTSARYVRPVLIPNDTLSLTLERKDKRFAGIFQVTLVMPPNAGAMDAETLADSLAAAFPPQTPITEGSFRIHITDPASRAPAISAGERYEVPVSISYVAHSY